jgi:hypothetical protein
MKGGVRNIEGRTGWMDGWMDGMGWRDGGGDGREDEKCLK